MKYKILISLTGAVIAGSLTTPAALGREILSGQPRTASLQTEQKLPEKIRESNRELVGEGAIEPIVPKPQSISRVDFSAKPRIDPSQPNREEVASTETNTANETGNISLGFINFLPDNATGNANSNATDNPSDTNNVSIASPLPSNNPTPEAINQPRLPEGFIEPEIINPLPTPSVVAFNPYLSPSPTPPVTTPFQTGEASWYGPGFDGNYSANGEVFNQYDLTAAHPTLPFGTRVRVTNMDTGQSVVVRINDRGPFAGDRVIDLSLGAAESLGMIDTGVAEVQLDIVQP